MITGNDKKVTKTKHYWIQEDKLSTAEGAAIDVYSVKSVDAENLSQEEVKEHDELMEKTRRLIEGLLSKEKSIMDAQSANVAKIARPGAEKALDSRDRKTFIADLRKLEDSLDELREMWKKMTLPDFSLLYMRNIKILQLMSLETSIEHTIRYAETGDPTYREYAKVQMDQVRSFDESFKTALPWK